MSMRKLGRYKHRVFGLLAYIKAEAEAGEVNDEKVRICLEKNLRERGHEGAWFPAEYLKSLEDVLNIVGHSIFNQSCGGEHRARAARRVVIKRRYRGERSKEGIGV